MDDDTKIQIGLIALAALFLVGLFLAVEFHENRKHEMRAAVCQNTESIACILAVRP
jgi:hypothetical protein